MKRCLVVLAVLALVACRTSNAKPDYPSLDPDPGSTSEPSKPTGPRPPEAPAPVEAEFDPPAAAPTGAPVVITWKPVTVGETRVRDIREDSLYSSTWEDSDRRQQTTRHFRLRERVTEVVDGRTAALEVSVEIGDENVAIDGDQHPETLISGDYLITFTGGKITASRGGTGFPIGDREREELQEVYGGELARDAPLLGVIRGRKMRVGETSDLTEAEKTAAGGGEPVDIPIALSLESLDAGVATYVIAFWRDDSTDDGTEVRGVKMSFGLEVATGRIRTMAIVDARGDKSAAASSTSRRSELTTITY